MCAKHLGGMEGDGARALRPSLAQESPSYLSVREFYNINFSVFAVDARDGDVNSHIGMPSRGLERAGFEAASATDLVGRRTVHFPTTLPFSKPILRMTPIYVISDSSERGGGGREREKGECLSS